MKIKTIHSYLVHPEKSLDQKSTIKGTEIEHKGDMFKMLEGIFTKAPTECNCDIAFQPKEDGSQENEVRNLILDYIKAGDFNKGGLIANRLQAITTNRSGLGLFFLILGTEKKTKRIVLSRFPADTGILAEESAGVLSVEFVERIFMKSAKAYKSACYEGTSYDADFWTGKAIDKQINNDMAISDYWIKEFLSSDFATTGERGTKRFATALKNAINTSTDFEIKDELTAVLKLAKNLNGKLISPASVSKRLNLSQHAETAIKTQLKPALYTEQFKLVLSELNKIIAFKSVELDNGAYLSAQAQEFDTVFKTSDQKGGKFSFSTTGKIINEKVRKSKA
jgi:hypothetical protein